MIANDRERATRIMSDFFGSAVVPTASVGVTAREAGRS
jgi:hypothetical protein